MQSAGRRSDALGSLGSHTFGGVGAVQYGSCIPIFTYPTLQYSYQTGPPYPCQYIAALVRTENKERHVDHARMLNPKRSVGMQMQYSSLT